MYEELAINGGKPIRSKPFTTYEDGTGAVDDKLKDEICSVLDSGRLFRYDTRNFEDTKTGIYELSLAKYFGTKYALALSSGTAAITVALMSLNLPKGFKVACPAFGFPATASAVILAGGEPCLFGIDENLHLDLNDLNERGTSDISVIIVVHMRGFSNYITEILDFAKKNNIIVIEDAVPSLGVKYNNKLLGTFGKVGCFSTQSDKTINTGEGVFLVTNDRKIYEHAIILSGAYEGRYLNHVNSLETLQSEYQLPLFNFRMDELRATLATSQLKKIDDKVSLLKKNYNYLINEIEGVDGVRLRVPVEDNAFLGSALVFFVDKNHVNWIVEALCQEGIPARTFGSLNNVRSFMNWHFMSSWNDDFTKKCPKYLENSAEVLSSSIDIPLSVLLSNDDLLDIAVAIKRVMQYIIKNQ